MRSTEVPLRTAKAVDVRGGSRFAGGARPGTRSAGALLARLMPTSASVALLLLAIGTPVAVLLTPHAYQPQGAMRASGTALTLSLLLVPALWSLRHPLSSMRSEHLLMLGLAYWLLLDLIQGNYPLLGVTRVGMQSALIGIGAFAVGIWISALFRPWRLPAPIRSAASMSLSPTLLYRAMVACFVIGILRYAIPSGFDPFVMLRGLAGNRWSGPWSRGAFGGWDAIIDHMAYFGYVVPALTVMIAHQTRRVASARVVSGIVMSLVMVAFLAHSGSRRVVGVVFGAALITWMLSAWGQLRLRTIAAAACASILIIVFLQWILVYRTVGYGQALSGASTVELGEYVHVDDNILRVGQTMDLVPQFHDYVYFDYAIWVIVRPIPRVLWPGKPTAPQLDVTQMVESEGATLSSSIVGEAYMSFGWLGVLLTGVLYGRIASAYNSLVSSGRGPARTLLYAFGVMSLFAGLRSAIDLVLMSYTVLVLVAVLLMLGRRTNAASPMGRA